MRPAPIAGRAIVMTALKLAGTLGLVLVPSLAPAAWPDGPATERLPAHYVHLSGHGGNNDDNRKSLWDSHLGCVGQHRAMGQFVRQLSEAELPAVVQTHDVELHYAADRSLRVDKGTLAAISSKDCALEIIPHHVAEISWPGAKCSVDLIHKVARGSCDAKSLGVATGAPLWRGSAASQGGDMRTVADLSCRVHVLKLGGELCIAELPAQKAPNPSRYFAPPLNSGFPGLLLDAQTPWLTLRVVEVRLNQWVSPQMFEVPTGVDLNPGARR